MTDYEAHYRVGTFGCACEECHKKIIDLLDKEDTTGINPMNNQTMEERFDLTFKRNWDGAKFPVLAMDEKRAIDCIKNFIRYEIALAEQRKAGETVNEIYQLVRMHDFARNTLEADVLNLGRKITKYSESKGITLQDSNPPQA